MKYLSVCSGIEAATVAWHDLGWEPSAFSEIEPFPSAVLKHHYPKIKNLGDMTKFEEWDVGTIDLLVGGTPCQSFSVAGLRKGLDDPRGNLMLTYGAIARRFRPKWLVWENVPGVLSSNEGRDFATFLGMLAELGYGFAYRVLDAQYFGVAQRRRRVFVVGCLGDWRSAAAVLFERSSLSGNPAPSREARKGTSSGTQTGAIYGGADSELANTVTSKWAKGSGGPSGNEGGLFVAQPAVLMDQGGSVMEVKTDGIVGTLRRETHGHEPVIMQPLAVPEVMSTLLSSTAGISRPGNAVTEHETYIPMAFAQNTRDEVRWVNGDGQIDGALAAEAGMKQTTYVAQPMAYRKSKRAQSADDDESWVEDGVANTINLFDQGDVRTTHAVVQPIPLDLRNANRDAEKHDEMNRQGVGIGEEGDPSHTLTSACVHGVAQPIAWDEDLNARENIAGTIIRGGDGGRRDGVAQPIDFRNLRYQGDEISGTMQSKPTGGYSLNYMTGIQQNMAVRRLTPVECERLQGFPDDYTRIPWRKGETPDGPRYKALGNSMAVPVMAWIGQRIQAVNDLPK